MSFEEIPQRGSPAALRQEKPRLPNVRLEGTKDPALKGEFHDYMETQLHTQDSPTLREIQKVEQKPTPEEAATIQLVDHWTNALLKRYGIAPIHIPTQAVHILSYDNLPHGWETDVDGRFYSDALSIAIVRQPGQYPFARINFHEMLHAKSRLTARFGDKHKLLPKRLGLSITGRTIDNRNILPEYFRWMNEAVTEELTKIFVQACMRAGKWHTEYQSTREILSQPDLPEDIKTNINNIFFASRRPHSFIDRFTKKSTGRKSTYEFQEYAYPEERVALNILISALYEKNRDQFQSREQVFDVFARTMLDDGLLPLGRLIERTFGRGSFKKIGSLGSIDELRSLIETSR